MSGSAQNYSVKLRTELRRLAESYANANGLEQHIYRSRAKPSTILFKPFVADALNRHGNFMDESYAAILANDRWKQRLKKPHGQRRALNMVDQLTAGELDSCCSSDALLMNVFCHKSNTFNERLASLFGLTSLPTPDFGFKANLPLANGRREHRSSEIDMRLSDSNRGSTVLIESKLTEADFTEKEKAHVEAYFGFDLIFRAQELALRGNKFQNYQLIRNILAAHHLTATFCLICDERRPDLHAAFHQTLKAVSVQGLVDRCRLITWQQIASTLPVAMRDFLRCKYGIESLAN